MIPRNNKRFQYLLKGLVRCAFCGRPLTGQSQSGRCYYRHNRGEMPCQQEPCPHNRGYHRDDLEPLVWDAISSALQDPALLAQEYQRRLSEAGTQDSMETERRQGEAALKRLKTQEDRLIDAYKNEALELPQFKEEMDKLRSRRRALERQQQDIERQRKEQVQAQDILARLESFCQRVSLGLDHLTFEERQKLLRLLVDRIVVDGQKIRIEGVIPLSGYQPETVLRPTRLNENENLTSPVMTYIL